MLPDGAAAVGLSMLFVGSITLPSAQSWSRAL